MTTDTLTDPWLGTRPFPMTSLAIIEDQHRLLCAMRNDGRTPSQKLLDDIAAYEAVLTSDDREARAELYFKDRDLKERPRDIARRLGWIE